VVEAIVGRFGEGVAKAGVIDRDALAGVAFSDPDGRSWLELLIWPLVGERIAEWRAEQDEAEPRPRAAVVEVPLLFESGMDAAFDSTIAVTVDEAVRERRARSRGHQAVDERTARQLSQSEKAERATVTVRNDGTPDALKDALSSALGSIGV
jgi:dephospho-CoA kinase